MAATVGGALLLPMSTHAGAPAHEVVVIDPPAQAEVIPVPRSSVEASASRTGRGLLAAGGVLLGLGLAGRFAIEGFWAGPARLEASEPFGQWSIPNIALFTAFSNVLVVPGLVLTGVGARRHGRWRTTSGTRPADPARTRRHWRLGWGLLGGGLSLWAITRAAALPVLRACETNGCAYGYLESTYWLGAVTVVPGVVLTGLAAGERAAARRLSVVPTVGPGWRGLSLGGRF